MLVNDEISFDDKNVQFVNVIETMTMFEKSMKMTMSIVSMMMMKTMNEFDDDDEVLLMTKTNETNCISIGDNNANENNHDDWNSIDDDHDDDDDDELLNMMTKDDVENSICVHKAMEIDDLWKSSMIRSVFDEIFFLLMSIDVVLVIKFSVFQFFSNCPNFVVVTNWNFVFCRR